MAAWGSQSFVRLSRGDKKVSRDEVKLGFRVDNIHWADDDKTLIAVGQGPGRWIAVRIDPMTLAVSELLNREDAPGFGAGTVAAEVGKTFWIGSYMREALRQSTDPILLVRGCSDSLKAEMLRTRGVLAAACSMGAPQWGFQLGSAIRRADREPAPTRYLGLDFGFFELFGMHRAHGVAA